jgi:hypothetical protein
VFKEGIEANPDLSDLRVDIQHFCKELLRSERRTVGRLDSRLKGVDDGAIGETPDFDPSLAAIRPPYTAMLNHYVRGELGYKSDRVYHILGGGIGTWDWGGTGRSGFPDVSGALRQAFSKNPDMKLFVASGHYDLATPYFATEYTLAHLGLEPAERARVTTREYEAGHMMYIHGRAGAFQTGRVGVHSRVAGKLARGAVVRGTPVGRMSGAVAHGTKLGDVRDPLADDPGRSATWRGADDADRRPRDDLGLKGRKDVALVDAGSSKVSRR